jgi:hypothetical protein
VQLNKLLTKKLKLAPERMALLSTAMIEAHTAMEVITAPPDHLTAVTTHASLTKEQLENVLAHLAELSAADLAPEAMLLPSKRVQHLEHLALKLCDGFNWVASQPELKRCAEVLAKSQGAMFAKLWRAKPSSSIFGKLNFRRGQTGKSGWLTDALQGRIICDDTAHVSQVAAFFHDILQQQSDAVANAGRPRLGQDPKGTDIAAYDLTSLQNKDRLPVDLLSTYVSDLAAEGTASLVLPTSPAAVLGGAGGLH